MKTMKHNQRRKFLMAAGAATAGAAAVVTTGRKPDVKAAEAAAPGAQPTGYHVTEHMLKYYKTAKV
jgi:hypothetical protein